MADGKIRVKFEAEGSEALISAIKELNKQTKRLGLEQKKSSVNSSKLNTQQERQIRNQNLLNSSLKGGVLGLATIRAKMLLYAFAIRQATVFMGGFIKEAAAFDGVERSFNQLAFSTDLSADSLKEFSNAANNTISSMDIMTQANNAMLLGVADSTEQLAEMFTISHKLAKAVGKDATFGMESLTTGIGRQSRLMLDNLGIIVVAEKAYEKYANTLSKKAAQLTDSEKKQAFLNEAMHQAKEMASLLPTPIDDTTDKYNKLSASLADSKVAFTQAFTEGVTPMLDGLLALSELMDAERINAYVKVIGAMAVATGLYVAQLKLVVIWQTRTGWGSIATAIGLATEALIRYTDVFDTSNEATKGLVNETQKYMESLKQIKVAGLEAERVALLNENAILRGNDAYNVAKQAVDELTLSIEEARKSEAGQEVIQGMQEKLVLYKSMLVEATKTNSEERESIAINKKLIEIIDEYISVLSGADTTFKDYTENQTKLNKLFMKTPESQRAAIEGNIEWLESIKASFGSTEEFNAVLAMLIRQLDNLDKKIDPFKERFKDIFKVDHESLQIGIDAFSGATSAIKANVDARMNHELEALRKTDEYKRASSEAQKKMEKEKTDEFRKQRKVAFYAEKASNLASVGMNIATAYTKALAQGGGLFGIPLAQLVAVLGAVQLAAIASTPAPKFEQGGLIGGRRHSQGGTTIEAERGEFIMSRNAVNSIGVENLNRMNDGGGGSQSISININGGMISPDFVENELAESIREAVRKGADFGIS